MTSLSSEVSKLEKERDAALADARLLAKVREVLGPTQLAWVPPNKEATQHIAAALARANANLRCALAFETLDLSGTDADVAFEEIDHAVAAAVKTIKEASVPLAIVRGCIRALNVTPEAIVENVARLVARPDRNADLRIEALGHEMSVLREHCAREHDAPLDAVLDRLRAAGRLEDKDGPEELDVAVCGLLEDLECAKDDANAAALIAHSAEQSRRASADDLERIDAMIADEKCMTWDLSSKDRAMLTRVRAALAPKEAKPEETKPEETKPKVHDDLARRVETWERAANYWKGNFDAIAPDLVDALDLALSVARDCEQRWSRGHPERVSRAQAVLDRARPMISKTAETPAKSAAPTSAVESVIVEPDEAGGAPPTPPSSHGAERDVRGLAVVAGMGAKEPGLVTKLRALLGTGFDVESSGNGCVTITQPGRLGEGGGMCRVFRVATDVVVELRENDDSPPSEIVRRPCTAASQAAVVVEILRVRPKFGAISCSRCDGATADAVGGAPCTLCDSRGWSVGLAHATESVARPADDAAGPFVIMRTIPKGGRQLYVETTKAWAPVADVAVGRVEPLSVQFADIADAEGVKRGEKLKRVRVCTFAEAMAEDVDAKPIDPEYTPKLMTANNTAVDERARKHPCPTCNAEPGYCCSFALSAHASISSNRCHKARRAFIVDEGAAAAERESIAATSSPEGQAP